MYRIIGYAIQAFIAGANLTLTLWGLKIGMGLISFIPFILAITFGLLSWQGLPRQRGQWFCFLMGGMNFIFFLEGALTGPNLGDFISLGVAILVTAVGSISLKTQDETQGEIYEHS